jgi:hypothetical protein
MTENQAQARRKCLAAKEGLSYEEIVGAYIKRKLEMGQRASRCAEEWTLSRM